MSDDEALSRWRQADELADQMASCSGWSIWRDLRSIDDTAKVFHGNHHELNVAAVVVDDPGKWLPLVSLDNREGHAKYMDELDRLFHNYLASAYSLSSCMYKVYKGRGWATRREGAEYLRRAPIMRPGLPAFMFGLRNVAQHERIPLTTSNERGWRDATGEMVLESYLVVIRDAVQELDWSKSKEGLRYLEDLVDDPRLDVVVPEFTTELLRFAAWFKRDVRRVYARELLELEELHLRHYELMRPFCEANRPEPPTSAPTQAEPMS